MTQYNGILIRQNLQDTGSVPRTGGWTACPDLIPYGTEPVQKPTDFFSGNYNQDVGNALVAKAENYIYVRGKNLTDSPLTGTARVFYAPQSLFLYPSQWLQNTMTTMNGSETSDIVTVPTDGIGVTPVAPNGIGVTVDPFTWVPSDINEHHCLITIVSTPDHPYETQVPGDNITSLNDLAAWIAKTGGSGWHNIQITTAGAPTFTNSTHYPPSSTPEKVMFTLTAENVPVGAEVAFSCGKPLPDGTYINLPKTTVTKNTQFQVSLTYPVPAGWESDISYSYYENGKGKLPGFKVSMCASVVSSGTDAIAAFARPVAEVFPNSLYHNLATGMLEDMPVNHIVPVGSDATQVE